MRQDQRGCRQVLRDGSVGCLVLLASLAALVLLGLRASRRGGPDHGENTVSAPLDEGPVRDLVRSLSGVPER